ncbi:hypothetical protein AFCA_001395 [Aspergillus flavus]|uniref:AT hook motif protein n=1 Tax=Aspergillus flavus TaxID=5059 RepID=A0AB74CFP2_ASPFL|nr:AT hook motif protein [Aspergillus flavus]RAQ59507.1 AT hook motif protein [Aspergillus flavus]RAQ71458.1 AT hook motif protein [Aspergillus flavus]RMZ45534.1 AT hook motif protein [Aspergillus flavus]UCK58543.1 hypothetical protein AFCA_001395 [Aspergillus flavus]
MPINWTDPQADAKLLVGIITLHNVKLDYKALAEYMGQGCTSSAIQHRVQRIKEKFRNDPPAEGTATGTSPGSAPQPDEGSAPDSSPTKPKRGRPAKRGAKGSPSKKAKASVEHDSA